MHWPSEIGEQQMPRARIYQIHEGRGELVKYADLPTSVDKFLAARDACEALNGEPEDFVVDLMVGDDLTDNFCIPRQRLERVCVELQQE